jgi:hypothetical protein
MWAKGWVLFQITVSNDFRVLEPDKCGSSLTGMGQLASVEALENKAALRIDIRV